MKIIFITFLITSCSLLQNPPKERPLQERQLIQCYLESDTYTEKKPFEARMSINVSEMGTVLGARIINATEKDPNLNSCLTYVMTGAGRTLTSRLKAGSNEKSLKFTPEGKHEL